jgi:alanine racemase
MGIDGDESITVDEIAEQAGTISYEVLTGLTARLPRVWSGCEDVWATASASGAIA